MSESLPSADAQDRARTKGVALAVLAAMCFSTWGVGLLQAFWGEYEPASGLLILNGKPLPAASIMLHPESTYDGSFVTPAAKTDADGAFRLRTASVRDGAPVGKYAVTVRLFRPTIDGESLVDGPNLLPEQYASPKTTPLSVEILPGSNRFNIEINTSHNAHIVAAARGAEF